MGQHRFDYLLLPALVLLGNGLIVVLYRHTLAASLVLLVSGSGGIIALRHNGQSLREWWRV
jgi:hypothetical protein